MENFEAKFIQPKILGEEKSTETQQPEVVQAQSPQEPKKNVSKQIKALQRKIDDQNRIDEIRQKIGVETKESIQTQEIGSLALSELTEIPEAFFIKNHEARKTLSLLAKNHPELKDIIIAQAPLLNKKEHPGGFFRYNRNSKIIFLEKFDENTLVKLRELTGVQHVMAHELKIPKTGITERMLTSFIISHEFGHASDALNVSFEEWESSNRAQEGRWYGIEFRRTRIGSHKERLVREYRKLPGEKSADLFAMKFMKENFQELFGLQLKELQDKYKQEKSLPNRIKKLFGG